MPRSPNTNDPLAVLVEKVIDDVDIRDRVRALCFNALDQAEYWLEFGNMQVRTQLMRTLVPGLVKAMDRRTESDEMAELKRQVADMMVELRTAAAPPADPVPDVVDVADVIEDAPRPTLRRLS